jgi:hypothetical protein
MSNFTIPTFNFDPSILVSYYQSQLATGTLLSGAAGNQAQGTNSSSTSPSAKPPATANDSPPWMKFPPSQQAQDAKVLTTTNFLDTSNVPLSVSATKGAATEQDNQKLFSLYNAINNLTYLSSMSQRSGMTPGQLQGFNTRFQAGLQQVESYLSTAKFNGFTLQLGTPSASATSTATVPFANFGYTGSTIVSDANIANALPGVSASDSFNIAVATGGTTTNVGIDLSQVQGPLTIDNIVTYVNQQLKAAGFSSTFTRTLTEGSISDPTKASYGIQINDAPGEALTLSSASATPALYLAGNTGLAASSTTTTKNPLSTNSTTTTTAADVQGRVVKLTNLGTSPTTSFNETTAPSSGTTTAQSTVVDGDGNVYVLGNAMGNFGSQLNQGTQDVYLSKYDSAGNLQWTRLVGAPGSASGYSMAADPTGGIVVAGTTTGNLSQTAIGDGNRDSFVAKYNADGDQLWTQQLPTLSDNQAASVSVDQAGNVVIGGSTTGVVGVGNVNQGKSDAYLAKIDASGNIVYQQQFGTSGNDTVGATAVTSDGSLIVASSQNGEAFLTKYANGDATSAPVWQLDLGALNTGGSIGGLAVSGNQVYVSGTTSNANLTAGGQASIVTPATSGTNAFVFDVTDQGTSATPKQVSYVGNDGSTQAGDVTVGPDGTVYLVGSTTGTFAGSSRNVTGAQNMFAIAINADGTIGWTRQYGGTDGTSTGQGIAVDPQGSSVLDALGLPRGTVDTNQSIDLTAQTTLRIGDSFQIKIQGVSGATSRTVTVRIDPGETVNSLVTKINADLVNAGKASVNFTAGAEGLKIQANSGFTTTLIAVPDGFDALSRLGLTPGILTGAANTNSKSKSTSSSSSSSSTPQVFGLGLTGNLDISTAIDAGGARATLMNVLNSIKNIYSKSNAPPGSSNPSTSQSTGTVSPETTAQLANFNLALNLLGSNNGGSSSTGIGTLSSMMPSLISVVA